MTEVKEVKRKGDAVIAFALLFPAMRHHYKKPEAFSARYGRVYRCQHPVYNRCTLFEKDGRGLAVIQQRFSQKTKTTYWAEIDPWLQDELYLHPEFERFFDERARPAENDLYPTVTIRQIMWSLRMKPLVKERWETVFDRKEI